MRVSSYLLRLALLFTVYCLLSTVCSLTVLAQVDRQRAGPYVFYTTLPATCTPTQGIIAAKITSPIEFYVCTAANTWTRIDNVSGGAIVADGDYGDVVVSSAGMVWTIDANVVTNAKLATIATATFKGRTTAGTGNVEDLTATQATTLLNALVGDSGSGGTKGLVPAPAAGDAAAAKFLKADGTWGTPSGAGDITAVIAGTGLSGGATSGDATLSVNTSQNIATLSNLTSNGFVKASGGVGTLSVDTTTYTAATRAINTTSPLAGGGDLSADRTLTCTTCTTNAAALTANQLVIGAGSQAAAALGSLGTTVTLLHGNAAGAPTFGAVVNGDITDGTIQNVKLTNSAVTVTAGAGLGTGGSVSLGSSVSLTWDASTYVNNVTLWDASQTSRTLTANLSGATDPVITFSNNSIDITTGVLKVGGSAVLVGNQTITLSGNVTGSGTTTITTAIAANVVADTMIRQSAGLSVIGRSANSTGNVADITGTDGQVLRVSGTALGFGTVANAGLANSSLTVAGTSNQVNTSGCGPVSLGGTCTLSTPQDIATSSTPQFARMGLGAAADGTIELLVSGASPQTKWADITASAKSLLLKIDADKANFYEAAGSAGLLTLDLANGRVGIATASPTTALDITGTVNVVGNIIGNGNISGTTVYALSVNPSGYGSSTPSGSVGMRMQVSDDANVAKYGIYSYVRGSTNTKYNFYAEGNDTSTYSFYGVSANGVFFNAGILQAGSGPTTLTDSAGKILSAALNTVAVANGGTNCSSASITCFNNITGFTAAGTTGTTSTNLVFSTSPTLVTPTLGVATGTRAGFGAAADGTATMLLQQSALGTTDTDGLIMQNTTQNSARQVSPRLRLRGSGTTNKFLDVTLSQTSDSSNRPVLGIALQADAGGYQTVAQFVYNKDGGGSGVNADNGNAGMFFLAPTNKNANLVYYNGTTDEWYVQNQGDTANAYRIINAGGTTVRLQLAQDGTLTLSKYTGSSTLQTDASGVVSNTSDERQKFIQGKFTRGLSSVLGLQPINYKWRPETGHDAVGVYSGFSAQNVRDWIPEATGVNNEGMLTLNDRPIVAALVNSVRELNAEIGRLKDQWSVGNSGVLERPNRELFSISQQGVITISPVLAATCPTARLRKNVRAAAGGSVRAQHYLDACVRRAVNQGVKGH